MMVSMALPAFVRRMCSCKALRKMGVAGNLVKIGDAMKEWIGLVAYYAMDRTDALFPLVR